MSVGRIVFALGIAVVLAAPATAAEPTAPAGPLIVGLRVSDELSGPILAQGRLVDASGAPTPGRAVAVAWPRMDALAALKDGDPIKTLPIAQVFAGRDGSFLLRADPRINLSEYAEDDGTINLDLRAAGDEGTGLWAFSRRLAPDRSAWVNPGRSDGDAEDLTVALDGPASAAEAAALDAENKTGICPDYLVATYDQRPVDIAESYTGPVNKAQFTYSQSASSTLGVGVSVSGAFGSFSVSGSLNSTAEAGVAFGQRGYNNRTVYQTTWQYRKIDIWQGYYTCSHWRYEARAVDWQGGALSWTPGSTPSATNCSPIEAGAAPFKSQGTAVTFTAGAKLSGQIGNNLSAQSGFTTKVAFSFPFTSNGRLCGSNTTWMTAQRVVGKGP